MKRGLPRGLIAGMAGGIGILAACLAGPGARADDFQLGMVIKSTTNPYYNATLAGAEMAAKEIGGSVQNYGPTESSAQAQVDIINNLADRSPRRALLGELVGHQLHFITQVPLTLHDHSVRPVSPCTA